MRIYRDNDDVTHFMWPPKDRGNLMAGSFCQKVLHDVSDLCLVEVPYITCMACIVGQIELHQIIRDLFRLKETMKREGWMHCSSHGAL
jgi:hypothetical protein